MGCTSPFNNPTSDDCRTDVTRIPGLEELWAETLGDPRICIAILDGPVDQSHPSLAGADLTRIETLVSGIADQGSASRHGTHVASVIFGQHDGPIKGIAPRCRGLIVPIFNGAFAACSQLDLARAILQAVQAGAHIINISGGELVPSGTAHPIFADAVRNCVSRNILIVAAAGNQGCNDLYVPAALPSVLAVGAMNSQDLPLEFSNWSKRYQTQGILAPGENIRGATPGGGTMINSGTSYATPIVSGIAALLLSLQIKRGQKPNPHAIRLAILTSALGYEGQIAPNRRLLAGRLNVKRAMLQIIKGDRAVLDMSETPENGQLPKDTDINVSAAQIPAAGVQVVATEVNGSEESAGSAQPPVTGTSRSREGGNPMGHDPVYSSVSAAACECNYGGSMPIQLIFALGKLDYDFGSEARRDSIMQRMKTPANPDNPEELLEYLETNPWDAAAIFWTLKLDLTTIYAIQGQGAFAGDVYQRLRDFLRQQIDKEVERVSIPGRISGKVKLSNGQVVPVIWPDLRGMFSWASDDLVEAVCGSSQPQREQQEDYGECERNVKNFLQRVYEELRNLGITSQDRAINYAATNALQPKKVFEEAIKEKMVLDTIEVERSPICRPESDCWDVKLTFFDPSQLFQRARKVYLFTVDVSDVVPVMVGDIRSWFVYLYPR